MQNVRPDHGENEQTRRSKMKSIICTLMAVVMLGFVSVSHAQTENAKTSVDEVKKETREMLRTLGAYSADKRDEAVEKAKQALNKLDKRIDAIESRVDANWDKMNDAARKEARKNLKALRKQRNQVAEWYGGMKTGSADAWDHVKKGFSDAYKDFESAWAKSEKDLDS
jgi:DNA repair exonuclease SbcCD ATPase subunit